MTWFSAPAHSTLPKKSAQFNMDSEGMVRMYPQSMTHPVLSLHIPVRVKHVHFYHRQKNCYLHSHPHEMTLLLAPCSVQTNTWKQLNFVHTEATPHEPDLTSGNQCINEPTILSIDSQSTKATSETPETPCEVPESQDGSG